MFSNSNQFGGKVLEEVKRGITSSTDVAIASGYVSSDIIAQFENDFYRLAEKGSFKLLVGMAFYEGLAGRVLRQLQNIENKLQSVHNGSGIFVSFTGKFHGKIYSFRNKSEARIFVGSSNFSRSGLSENLECTTLIKDEETRQKVIHYLDYLFSDQASISINKADIAAVGSREYLERIALENLSDLERYEAATIDKSTLESFEYPLSRVATSEKSSLNVYFGKGRLARSIGKITPRPWYEVELIAPNEINSNPLYPKGNFMAYTDDGYIMPMKTSGDYFKNIRSRANLQILGQWIKGKLQNSGALIPLTPVTQDTLDKYGNDTIRFYKIRDQEYYMEF